MAGVSGQGGEGPLPHVEGRGGHALGGAEVGDGLTGPAEPLHPLGPLPTGGFGITAGLRHRDRHGDILQSVWDAADDTSPVNHVIRRTGTVKMPIRAGSSAGT